MSTQEQQDVCVHIRWMIRRDMAGVLEIEKLGFEFSWSEEDFVRCLRQRNCIGMVCEYEERVVGFMIYELHKNRIHVLNFAVHPDFSRSGAIELCWKCARPTCLPSCFSGRWDFGRFRYCGTITTMRSKMRI